VLQRLVLNKINYVTEGKSLISSLSILKNELSFASQLNVKSSYVCWNIVDLNGMFHFIYSFFHLKALQHTWPNLVPHCLKTTNLITDTMKNRTTNSTERHKISTAVLSQIKSCIGKATTTQYTDQKSGETIKESGFSFQLE
jgi:hypothetical protein